jgi:hypothetical protein
VSRRLAGNRRRTPLARGFTVSKFWSILWPFLITLLMVAIIGNSATLRRFAIPAETRLP